MNDLRQFYKQLWQQREQWVPHWQDIQDIMLPYRGRLDDSATQNDGKKKTDKRTDGTATRALRILASGMHGGLTSPSQKWFRLTLNDRGLTKFGPVRQWIDIVENQIYSALRQSNFYQAVQNVYIEQAGFGTACLFQEEHSGGKGVWFRVVTIGDFALATNVQGRIDTVFRRDWLTAKQLVEMFGDNVSESVKSMMKQTPYNFVKVIHAVMPRMERDPKKIDRKNMPFRSVYFEETESEKILGESGFEDFPFNTPRWDVVGSNVYGYSPGMEALPDVRGLNAIAEDLLIAVNKEVDPPVNVPDSIIDDVDLLPGGRNPSSGQEHVTATYQISPNLAAGASLKSEVRQDVNDWFFYNLFVLATNPNATATEILRKNEEQLVQLGPVIQREFNELLDPAIARTFNILMRQGALPDPPEEIQGTGVQIEYISTLAQAQKLVSVQKIERHVAFVGQMAAVDPTVLDNLDADEVVREHAEGVGTPAKIIRPADQVEQIRVQRAQQQQALRAQEQMNMAAQTASSLANAKMDEKNALTELVNAAAQ